MTITEVVEKEIKTAKFVPKTELKSVEIYSPKLGGYVPVKAGESKGKIQHDNIGIGPGNWY